MTPTPFAIIGGGWRAEFYLRIAQAMPERLSLVGMVVRDAAKGQVLEQRFGLPTYRTLSELLTAQYAAPPAFVVTCVSWDANPGCMAEVVARGLPVLSETPPARSVQGLREVWSLVAGGADVQVAEQYIYQPHHAARLALVRMGLLGRVSQAQVSAAHGYHGLSLLRHLLGVSYEPVTIQARKFVSPLVAGPNRDGPPQEERLADSSQQIAWLDYGDKLGVFDFCGDQYFSWVRGQRLLVRGERGEIIDQTARYLLDYRTPVELSLVRSSAGPNGNLEGHHLKGILAGERWLYENPTAPARLSDDEIALGTVLLLMADHVTGEGEPPYPLALACQDHYLNILVEQAIATGERVSSEPQPWQG